MPGASLIRSLCFASLLLFCGGCFSRKAQRHSHAVSLLPNRCLFIAMPANKKVFKNLSPQLYRVFWDQCERSGYEMRLCDDTECNVVALTVTGLDIPSRFVSPDIVPYSNTLRLEVLLELKDHSGKVLVKRPFVVSRWVSRPVDPVFEELYAEHELEKMCQILAVRIEHVIRKSLADRPGQ